MLLFLHFVKGSLKANCLQQVTHKYFILNSRRRDPHGRSLSENDPDEQESGDISSFSIQNRLSPQKDFLMSAFNCRKLQRSINCQPFIICYIKEFPQLFKILCVKHWYRSQTDIKVVSIFVNKRIHFSAFEPVSLTTAVYFTKTNEIIGCQF